MNLMGRFAGFIMSGRVQAVTIAVGFAILGALAPPLTPLSGSIVALVALRMGTNQALVVIGWATALLSILSLGLFGQFQVGLIYGLAQWLPVLVFALLLRRTVSWPVVLQVLAGVGMLVVVWAHLMNPDLAQYWQRVLQASLGGTLEHLGMNAVQAGDAMRRISVYFTGIFVASIALGIVISLLLARYWQALLYHPGGFGIEFTRWRLPNLVAGLMLLLAALAFSLRIPWVIELFMVGAVPFLLQGISLMHGLARQAGMHRGWLIGLYILLLFATLQMAALLTAFGVMDSFVDIRKRLAKKS